MEGKYIDCDNNNIFNIKRVGQFYFAFKEGNKYVIQRNEQQKCWEGHLIDNREDKVMIKTEWYKNE